MISRHILVVDDDPMLSDAIRTVAEGIGFNVSVANTAEDFYNLYSSSPPDIILLDLQMPQADSVELMRYLAETGCAAAILLVSGVDGQTIRAAMRLGKARGLNVAGILQKPVSVADLTTSLEEARSALA
jgi:CheY-like chemotaxis protein